MMMGRPCDGLDSCQMLRVRLYGRQGVQVPDVEPIVVATAGQILIVGRPLEAADLLSMGAQLALGHEAGGAHVPLKDHPVARARREDLPVPGQGADARRVPEEFVHLCGVDECVIVLMIEKIRL